MIKNETKLRVLYAHADIMNIANNTRYLEYFEAGRNELMRNIGYPYTKLEEKGIGLPLVEAHVKYIYPAKYDDILVISAFLNNLPTAKIKIDYEISVNGKLVANGYTTHAFVKLSGLRPVKPPDDFMQILKKYF